MLKSIRYSQLTKFTVDKSLAYLAIELKPRALDHSLLPSQIISRGLVLSGIARTRLAPIWDAGATTGGLS